MKLAMNQAIHYATQLTLLQDKSKQYVAGTEQRSSIRLKPISKMSVCCQFGESMVFGEVTDISAVSLAIAISPYTAAKMPENENCTVCLKVLQHDALVEASIIRKSAASIVLEFVEIDDTSFQRLLNKFLDYIKVKTAQHN